jgi:cysteine desulfurase
MSTPKPVYLDYNASALVRPEVQALMAEALADNGNPSAIHAAGRRARARIETARQQVAALVGADPAAVVFSSGGTESNAQAIASALAAGCERLIVGATEHPCIRETALVSGRPVEFLGVDEHGVVRVADLERMLRAGPRAVVAIHHANNESGVIQPIAEAARLVREHGGWLHVDVVQSAGKIPVDIDELGAHTVALSAHKLGGPQGSGALVHARGVELVKWVQGAGQERGLRGGTENVPGIAGFGLSAALAKAEVDSGHDHSAWRDAAAERVKAAGAVVIGEGAPRLPNTLFMVAEGWLSTQQLILLDLKGVMVSAGSACSSGKVKPSPALTAMGMGEASQGMLRVTGGWGTTEEDWHRFAEAWTAEYARQKAKSDLVSVA